MVFSGGQGPQFKCLEPLNDAVLNRERVHKGGSAPPKPVEEPALSTAEGTVRLELVLADSPPETTT